MYLSIRQRILMQHLLISFMILFFFSGCEDKVKDQAAHDAKVAKQARVELLSELEAKKAETRKASQETNETKLSRMGVDIDNGIITIDTNKTKDFFRELNQKMAAQISKISDDLEKGIIETKEAGVEVTEQHIYIDLNKTQDLLQDWGKKMQVFVQEIDEMAKTLETNSSNTTNKGI